MKTTAALWKALLPLSLILTLSACSITETPKAAQPESTSSASPDKVDAEYFDFVTDTSGFMPFVEGMALDQAVKVLNASGLDATFFDASPLKQKIEKLSDWIVTEQPEPGTEYPRNQSIRLGALRKGDPTESDATKFQFELSREDPIAPNFVGMNLAEVKDVAEKTEMYLFVDDASPEDRSVFNSSNWEVVKQDRRPGALMSQNSMHLTVQKIGEKYADAPQKDLHIGEMQFYGTIEGYEAESTSLFGPPEINFVIVDGAQIALDLISPYTYGCLDAGDIELADKDKKTLLPIGTKVRVVRTDQENEELGVIHLVENDNLLDPFRNSANQKLVERGFWIPTQSTNYSEVSYSSKTRYKIVNEYHTPLQRKYLEIIVKKATTARIAKVGGQKTCFAMTLRYEAQERVAAAARKKEEERWARELERQRRLWEEAHSCAGGARDGDGDGICNEG